MERSNVAAYTGCQELSPFDFSRVSGGPRSLRATQVRRIVVQGASPPPFTHTNHSVGTFGNCRSILTCGNGPETCGPTRESLAALCSFAELFQSVRARGRLRVWPRLLPDRVVVLVVAGKTFCDAHDFRNFLTVESS